uniref:Uncharacterized protein n=1 Tax=Panagrolaimus sp. JU765 TaxID=591449 RepID=A0AC34R5N5_9BILA
MLKKPGNRRTVSTKKSSKTPTKKVKKIVRKKSVNSKGKNGKNGGKSGGCCGCLKKKEKVPIKKTSSKQKSSQPKANQKSPLSNSSKSKTPTKSLQTPTPAKSITVIKPIVSTPNAQRNFDKRAVKTPPNRTSTTQQSPENESPRKPKPESPATVPVIKSSNSSIKVKGVRPISHENALKNCHNFQEVKIYSVEFENGMMERKMIVTSIFSNDKAPQMLIDSNKSNGNNVETTNYTTLARANSTDKITKINLSSEAIVTSPTLKSKESTNPPPKVQQQESSYRDRALSTLNKLRTHYQLTSDEIRILSKNADLKLIAIRAGLALQEAQRNLRNLKVLAGSHLLPDLSVFNDELSAVILELDRFMDAMQTFSEHAEPSPTTK